MTDEKQFYWIAINEDSAALCSIPGAPGRVVCSPIPEWLLGIPSLSEARHIQQILLTASPDDVSKLWQELGAREDVCRMACTNREPPTRGETAWMFLSEEEAAKHEISQPVPYDPPAENNATDHASLLRAELGSLRVGESISSRLRSLDPSTVPSTAMVVNMSDAAAQFTHFGQEYAENLAPSNDHTIFEWDDAVAGQRLAVSVKSTRDEQTRGWSRSFIFYYALRSLYVLNFFYVANIAGDGKFTSWTFYDVETGKPCDVGDDDAKLVTETWLAPVFFVQTLMHMRCQSVKAESYAPMCSPRKSIRNLPPLEHRVIVFREGKRVVRASELHEGVGKRKHIRRAHFATYTAEAPRFGRMSDGVGGFYIPACVVGSAELGVIQSTYQI